MHLQTLLFTTGWSTTMLLYDARGSWEHSNRVGWLVMSALITLVATTVLVLFIAPNLRSR